MVLKQFPPLGGVTERKQSYANAIVHDIIAWAMDTSNWRGRLYTGPAGWIGYRYQQVRNTKGS